jgi:hypothetical protein
MMDWVITPIRHSRAGGNPAYLFNMQFIVQLRRAYSINWIPAYAGMTSHVIH